MDMGTIRHRGEALPVDLDTGRGQFRVIYRGGRVSAISLADLKAKLAEIDAGQREARRHG